MRLTNIPFIPFGPHGQSLASIRRAHSAQYYTQSISLAQMPTIKHLRV